MSGPWTDSREITVTATTAVTDIFGRRLAQPVESRFRTVDLSAPTVVAVAPANGAIEVAAGATVTVTFSEELDPNASVAGVVALARANQEYQSKFGYFFLICATGKTSEEILASLRQRLLNDPAEELRIAAEEQRKITRIRLEKLLAS